MICGGVSLFGVLLISVGLLPQFSLQAEHAALKYFTSRNVPWTTREYQKLFCYCNINLVLQVYRISIHKGETLGPYQATSGTSGTGTTVARRKRMTVEEKEPLMELVKDMEKGVVGPTRGTTFSTTVGMSQDIGVLLNAKNVPTNCSCEVEHNVTVSFAILNKEIYSQTGWETVIASDAFTKASIPTIMNHVDDVMRKELPAGIYIRTINLGYDTVDVGGKSKLQANFMVQLNSRRDFPVHDVQTAIKPELEKGKITTHNLVVSSEDGAFTVEDITVEEIIPPHPMRWMLYILPAVGGGILLLLLFITCCGAMDRFNCRSC